MKAITVTELKSKLSRYLRRASLGEIIVVKDRNDPVAQLGPLDKAALPWRERLARQGRLRLGTQDWSTLGVTPLKQKTDIQAALQDIREDPSEVRRR